MAGVRLSIETMASRMREGRLDPAVAGWARGVLKDAGLDGRDRPSVRAQVGALLDALRKQAVYAPDAYGAEVISSASATLCLRPGLCINGGDCDDLSVALGSALLSLGIPVAIVKQSFGSDNQEHVLIAAQGEDQQWIYADPSTRLPVGSAPNATDEEWFDPMGEIGAMREASPEIVTLGAPPKMRHVKFIAGRWWEEAHGRVFVHHQNEWKPTGFGALPQPRPIKRIGLGTVLGFPTADELSDLIKVANYLFQQLTAAVNACAGWPANPVGWAAFQMDMQDLAADLQNAQNAVNVAIEGSLPFGGPKWTPVQYEWDLVTAVIKEEWEMNGRFDAAKACASANYSNIPQPTASDLDLEAYKASDTAVKAIESAARKVGNPVTIGVAGVVIGVVAGVTGILIIDRLLLPARR
jgi:hypothetical protein